MLKRLCVSMLLVISCGCVNAMERFYSLRDAFECRDEHRIMFLLNPDINADLRDVNVNLQDKNGHTPLYWAVRHGHRGIVQFLLEHGADTNIQGNEGESPIYLVAPWGDQEMVQLLLKHGAKVDLQDMHGHAALQRAITVGNQKMVQFLLNKGADANLKDNYGNTPLYWAAFYGHQEIVQLLEEWPQIKIQRQEAAEGMRTLAMAMHQRLGESSPANLLPGDMSIHKAIFEFLAQP